MVITFKWSLRVCSSSQHQSGGAVSRKPQHGREPTRELRVRGPGPGGDSDDGCSAELPRRDQGGRHRRGRRERREPDDRGRPPGRRVHRRQHRCTDAPDVRRRGEARHRPRDHARARRRIRSRCRQACSGGARRRDRGDHQGRRHGLHHRRRGRRDRHGRGADRRGGRAEPRRADDRGRHPTVRVRGPQARDPGRPRDHGAEEGGRHADRRPQRSAAPGRRREHADDRRVPDGRPGPVSGRRRHHVAHHDPRTHQPRLRRREVDHGRGRLRVDGDRTGVRARTERPRPRRPRSARRSSSPRSTARRACCSRSPARPT